MNTPRPIMRRLRVYWIAYCLITLLETACIAWLIQQQMGIEWAILALLWLPFRIFVRPTADQALSRVGRVHQRRSPSLVPLGLLLIAALSAKLLAERAAADPAGTVVVSIDGIDRANFSRNSTGL